MAGLNQRRRSGVRGAIDALCPDQGCDRGIPLIFNSGSEAAARVTLYRTDQNALG